MGDPTSTQTHKTKWGSFCQASGTQESSHPRVDKQSIAYNWLFYIYEMKEMKGQRLARSVSACHITQTWYPQLLTAHTLWETSFGESRFTDTQAKSLGLCHFPVQYVFTIKTSKKLGIKGTCVNKTKAIFYKLTANTLLNWENKYPLKVFLLKSTTQGCGFYSSSICPLVSLNYSSKARGRNKKEALLGKSVKLPPSTNNAILCRGDTKDLRITWN